MAKYRLLHGTHSSGALDPVTGKVIVHSRGDVFEDSQDLLVYNSPGAPAKFELVADSTPTGKTSSPQRIPDGLDNMSPEELRKFAEEQEIDLGKKPLAKSEILKLIRSALS